MRAIIFIIFLLNVLLSQTRTGNLTIKITNVKSAQGTIHIGLYNNEEHFPHKGMEYKKLILKATAPTFTYTIKNLPSGEYALAVFHDANSDGKIKRSFLGVPKEDYGFSNNVKPFLSAPSFEKVKFRLHSDTTIVITLFR